MKFQLPSKLVPQLNDFFPCIWSNPSWKVSKTLKVQQLHVSKAIKNKEKTDMELPSHASPIKQIKKFVWSRLSKKKLKSKKLEGSTIEFGF